MKLIDFFKSANNSDSIASFSTPPPDEALASAFEKLTCGDGFVAEEIRSCQSDTKEYFASRNEILDRHGLKYSPEAEP